MDSAAHLKSWVPKRTVGSIPAPGNANVWRTCARLARLPDDSLDRAAIDVPERRLRLWLFVLVATAFFIVQEGVITPYDGQTMYAVTRSLIDYGTAAVSTEFNTLPGPDGRAYARYGLGMSLLAAIPYAAVRPFTAGSPHADQFLEAAVSFILGFVAAALVVALYVLARQLGARAPTALLVSVGAVAGTFVLPYGKEFLSEPLTALCVVVAIERLLAGRASIAGLALGAAVLVRPQCLLIAPLLLLVGWRRHGLAAALQMALGTVPGVAATFAYNIVRFGDPLQFGYSDVGFTTPFLSGTLGLLFHPTKSLLLFAPVSVVLPFALWHLWRLHRAAFVLIAGNLAVTFVTAAMWFAWHGGWSWGPRLLIPGLLPAIAAVGPWLDRPSRQRVVALLLFSGFVLSFPALIVSTQAQQLEAPPISQEELRRGHFMPTQPLRSPWPLRQAQLVIPTVRYSLEHAYDRRNDGLNHLRSLSVWQLGATRVLGRAGLIAGVTATALLLWGTVVAWRRVASAAAAIVRIESAESEIGRGPGRRSRSQPLRTWAGREA